MSYILEALKKADAAREREREAVPGLHSRHDHALPDEADERAEAAPAARTPWLVGGVAGGVAIAGALFWLLGRSGPDAPIAGETRPMPLHGQVGEASPPPQAPVSPPPALAPVQPTPVQAAPVQAAPVQTARPTSPQPAVVTEPPPAVTARVPSVPSTSATPAPTTPTTRATAPAQDPLRVDPSLRESGPKIVSMQELPDDIRRELPQFTVGGAMHSDVAANRMLVLNGGVFREGDQPAPGVVLEEIRLKSAVLRYKGHRYSISY
jgi:general secretion pathway protein B